MGGAELARWSDVEGHLRATGRPFRPFSDDSGAGVRFLYPHRSGPMLFGLRPVAFPGGRQWLGITVPVCEAPRLKLRGALLANTELPIGGLATFGDHVVLRQIVPLEGLRVAALEAAFRALADTAAELRVAAASTDGGADVPYAYAFR